MNQGESTYPDTCEVVDSSSTKPLPYCECRNAVHAASKRLIHPGVIDILQTANSILPESPERTRNLKDLATPGTVAVITGQQTGLFLGPAFTFYKALSAIHYARALQTETGIRAVPVFWLQTEDHDFQEMNRCAIPDPMGDSIEFSIPTESAPPPRTSASSWRFGSEIQALTDILEQHLSHFGPASGILDVVKESYSPGTSFAEAFLKLLGTLFSEEGLVLFDPRHPDVADLTRPVFERCLHDYRLIAEKLESNHAELREQNIPTQVHLRNDSPLFFYHDGSVDAPRYRLRLKGECWESIGAEITLSNRELERMVHNRPELFSSSALLRPIVQDTLFPTASYVAGPSESAYFNQVNCLYDVFGLPKPLIAPRASFLCIDSKATKWLEQLGISAPDLLRPQAELRELVLRHSSSKASSPEELNKIVSAGVHEALSPMRVRFSELDKTLLDSLSKVEQKIARQVSLLSDRYGRALITKDSVSKERLTKVRNLLFPKGMPQERYYSALYFLCRYGDEHKRALCDSIRLLDGSTVEVKL